LVRFDVHLHSYIVLVQHMRHAANLCHRAIQQRETKETDWIIPVVWRVGITMLFFVRAEQYVVRDSEVGYP
jgi:hypothetical protein